MEELSGLCDQYLSYLGDFINYSCSSKAEPTMAYVGPGYNKYVDRSAILQPKKMSDYIISFCKTIPLDLMEHFRFNDFSYDIMNFHDILIYNGYSVDVYAFEHNAHRDMNSIILLDSLYNKDIVLLTLHVRKV